MEAVIEGFRNQLQHILNSGPDIVAALVAFIILNMLGRLASRAINRITGTGEKSRGVKQVRLVRRLVRWTFNLLGLVIALNLLGLQDVAMSFLAAGGVVAVVLGFAFREIGENLLAGLFLSFSRSFDVGDLIESDGIRGIVKRIEIRDVHLRTADGCDIFIPSASIYKNPLLNFTRDGLRRGSFTIGIDYGDNLNQARSLLLEHLKQSTLIISSPEPEIQLSGFTPSYVELEVFFWINTFESKLLLSEARTEMMSSCHQLLANAGFTFSSNVTTAVDLSPATLKVDLDKLES